MPHIKHTHSFHISSPKTYPTPHTQYNIHISYPILYHIYIYATTTREYLYIFTLFYFTYYYFPYWTLWPEKKPKKIRNVRTKKRKNIVLCSLKIKCWTLWPEKNPKKIRNVRTEKRKNIVKIWTIWTKNRVFRLHAPIKSEFWTFSTKKTKKIRNVHRKNSVLT